MKTLLLLALFCMSSYCYAVNVNGVVLLQGAGDHSGVTIAFIPKSPSAVAIEVISLSDGSYSTNVVAGVYDIRFSKPGYDVNVITDQFISTTITFSQFTLANAPPENVSGNVSGTWVNTKTYIVTGNIVVPSGTELIIQPGTTVKFAGYFRMQVYGKLTALGTGTQKILITSTASSKARGDWAGIEVYTTADTTRFDHCQVEYGGNEMDNKAVIYNTGKLRISNSLIRGGGYAGVYNSNGGYVKLHRSEITDCYFYGYVGGSTAAGASITYNHIHHNDRIGAQCAWTVDEFIGNEVDHNAYTGVQAYGFGLYEKNLLHHNPQGIFVIADKPTIRNNTIINNNEGIRFYNSDSWHPSAIIHSNIIAHNSGWGIYCEGVYKPETVEYNLIYSNPMGVANRGPVGLGSVITTNARGFASDTYMNIFESPGFVTVDESSDDYLELTSRCAAVDTGDPRFKDPDGSIADCGAIPFEKDFQQITFDPLTAKTFGDSDFTLSATASTGLPLTFSSSNTAIASVQGNTVSIHAGGRVNIIARQEGNIDYRPTELLRELVINPATQSITFAALSQKTFGDANFTLTASASSGLTVSYESSDTNIASITGNIVTIKRGGTVEITASQVGNASYALAEEQTQQLVINPATQSITFDELATTYFHNRELELEATASSGLSVSFESSDENIATIEGNILSMKNTGTVTITARQPGNESFQASPTVDRELTILKGEQYIEFDSINIKTFGDASFALNASSTSGLPIHFTSSNEGLASVAGNMVTINGAGTVLITAHQPGNANYHGAPDSSRYLVIRKADQAITFGALTAKTFGDEAFQLNATSNSGLPVSFTSSNESLASIAGNIVTLKGAGTVSITAHQPGNENYKDAPDTSRDLVINKADQAITFGTLTAKTFGDETFQLNATSNSGLPVSFTSSNESLASVTGNTVSIRGAGAVSIIAHQQGNSNYNTAPEISRELTINKLGQTISFTLIPAKTVGDPDFSVVASTTSNLPLTFKSLSDIISVQGTLVKVVKPGRATIEAKQDGDGNYSSSTTTQSFCIKPAQPVITMEINDDGVPVLTSSNDNGNQWYFKGTAIEGATGKMYSSTTIGTYTVRSTTDDCMSSISAPFTLLYTGTGDEISDFTVQVFPNPAKDKATILVSSPVLQSYSFRLQNLFGTTVLQGETYSSDETLISLNELTGGVYYLTVDSPLRSHTVRVIKE